MEFVDSWKNLKSKHKALGSSNVIYDRIEGSEKLVSLGVSSTNYYLLYELENEYQEKDSELVNCVGFSCEYKIRELSFSSHHLVLSCAHKNESELIMFLSAFFSIDMFSLGFLPPYNTAGTNPLALN